MRTVKEVAALAGVSVRTLHYYDEIGLLAPTATTEAGYRLYDDDALERLQQILYFREFDFPLETVKSILDNPALDRETVWRAQKRMLEQKAARLRRQIDGIDGILKGENRMDFAVFDRAELEAFYAAQLAALSPQARRALEACEGGEQGAHDEFMRQAASRDAQQQYAKIAEWYGGRENMREAALHPYGEDISRAMGKRIDAALERLAQRRGEDVGSFAVREVVGELDYLYRMLFRIRDARDLMLAMARDFLADTGAARMDERFGCGTAAFFSKAFRAFYREDGE